MNRGTIYGRRGPTMASGDVASLLFRRAATAAGRCPLPTSVRVALETPWVGCDKPPRQVVRETNERLDSMAPTREQIIREFRSSDMTRDEILEARHA
jgi:hypothetical protein